MANYKITQRMKKDKNGNIKGTENCIIVDFVNLTENERQAVEMYVKGGYTLYPKKEKKDAKPKKERIIIKKEDISNYLSKNGYDDKVSIDLLRKLEAKQNFMNILTYFKDIYFEYPAKADKSKLEKRAEYYEKNYRKNMSADNRKKFINDIKNI